MYKSLIAILLLLAVSSLQSKTIKGKLYGFDDKPMLLAHVNYEENGKQKKIQVNKDGSFELNVNEDYFLVMEFTGVNHQSFSKKIFFPDDKNPIDITVKLTPNQIPKKFDKIIVVGNFNDFNWESDFLEMKENSDSIYVVTTNPTSDTLLYQVIFDTGKDNRRSFNGQQSDFYVYDGGGDYRSGILTRNKEVNLTLDLKHYPQGKFKSEVSSVDNKVNLSIKLGKQLDDISYSHLVDASKVFMNNKNFINADSVITSLKKKYLDSIEYILHSIKDKNLRFFCLLPIWI